MVLIEIIADIAHRVFCRWAEHLLKHCGGLNEDGEFVIPKANVDAWVAHACTAYGEQCEKDKERDRDVAWQVLAWLGLETE